MELVFRGLFFVALFSITYLAMVPDYSGMPEIFSWSDKLNHVAAFFVLTLLLENGFKEWRRNKVISSLISYGILIELMQFYLPTRYASISDILADSIGDFLYFIVKQILK